MVAWVPLDIFEAVVDHLYDDKATLAACSLVSWAWLPRSRYRLFRSITYRAPLDEKGFIPFLDFLRSSPALARLIREVILDGLIADPSLGQKFQYHEWISCSTLLDILDSLPALVDFELRRLWFIRPATWTAAERQRFEVGTARELALHRLVLHSIGYVADGRQSPRTTLFEFQSILSIFSSVQVLYVHNLSSSPSVYDFGDFRVELRDPLCGQTQPFSIIAHDRNYSDEFWDVIYSVPSPVRVLSLRSQSLGRIKALKGIHTELRHLSLNCLGEATFGGEISVQFPLNLSVCTGLVNIIVWAQARPSVFWENITAFLTHLPPSIQKFTVYVCCVNEDRQFLEYTHKSIWGGMREKLERLSNLRELMFTIQHHKQNLVDSATHPREVFDGRMRPSWRKNFFCNMNREFCPFLVPSLTGSGLKGIIKTDSFYDHLLYGGVTIEFCKFLCSLDKLREFQ